MTERYQKTKRQKPLLKKIKTNNLGEAGKRRRRPDRIFRKSYHWSAQNIAFVESV